MAQYGCSSNFAELSFLNVINDLGGIYTAGCITPTRNDSILDFLITSSPHLIRYPITICEPFAGSDHNSIIANVCFSKPLVMHAIERWKYMFQHVNYELLHDYLYLQDWSMIYSTNSLDCKWHYFIDTINNIIHVFVPKNLLRKSHIIVLLGLMFISVGCMLKRKDFGAYIAEI